ncbi:hypothetical protein Acife_0942 [Acidithiobacillus ferrivorans SS3]|uniref:Uncharacterized protein n=1 Tax=Acidithiobacillus ferrivorans SS3 TaxID=743299 RepID=G0JN08_9PROT|nr:hypothetical protein [Acidithiobacillus ferrivorans]AEM47113.1 hypothetical protein Acife_0942 [Acidithiobacillus ferrivorans SS3]OFA15470.1 hypothetical protein A4U49_12840 [Acidithiobacillus ferrivorans]
METIYTLNVRDHIMLPLIRDHFNPSSAALHREIRRLHHETVLALRTKGVNYADLRSGLTPVADKNEAGFIFDSTMAESGWYGPEAMSQALPLLDLRSTHSVLHGDLLGEDQRLIYEILCESMVLSRSFTFKHSTLLFCIYINNLSDAALARLHEGLGSYAAYVGHIPATFATRAKIYLSTTLGGAFLKFGSKVLLGHEDDRPNEENINLSPYPFGRNGYEIVSIQSTNYSLFLNFKIERPVFDPDEDDAYFSINAMSDAIIPLRECDVLLEDAKYGYLASEKLGKLTKAGLANLCRDELTAMIKSKITRNYIYNLTYMVEHDVMKFNVMLEVPRTDGGYPTRLTVALEYLPEDKLVRVITLH